MYLKKGKRNGYFINAHQLELVTITTTTCVRHLLIVPLKEYLEWNENDAPPGEPVACAAWYNFKTRKLELKVHPTPDKRYKVTVEAVKYIRL